MFYQDTLFPMFNINKTTSAIRLNNGMFLIEKEIGLIDEYIIDSNDFKIDRLSFSIINLTYMNENYQLLASISYKESKLQSIKSDSLITYRYCLNKLNKTL